MLNLTPEEIIQITGKKHHKHQVTALVEMSIPFKVRPDGLILVCRLAYLAAMGCQTKHESVEILPDYSQI